VKRGQLFRGERTGTRLTLVNIWATVLREWTGHTQNLSKREKLRWLNRQGWRVVKIQNTSALLQSTRWDTLLLSHPRPSEPKEVYQYLDALEVGRFELHVPVSGDLKENKKQGVKHHNSELSSCSCSREQGSQWPSSHPEGWDSWNMTVSKNLPVVSGEGCAAEAAGGPQLLLRC